MDSNEKDDHDYVRPPLKKRFFASANFLDNDPSKSSQTYLHTDVVSQTLKNQDKIQQQLTSLEEQLLIPEEWTLSKMLRENLVLTKQVYRNVQRFFGDTLTKEEGEVIRYFPFTDPVDMEMFQTKIEETIYEDAVRSFLFGQKSGGIDNVFKSIVKYACIANYNWVGRNGRGSLQKFKLFGNILHEIVSELDRPSFEKQMRSSIKLAHNRHKMKMHNLS